jgi:uncharacterized lipoprotein YmbA
MTLIAALAGLSGCGGKIRYPSYYVLNFPGPVTGAASSGPILGAVAVRQFGAPEYLRNDAIVYRQSPAQLGFYNYHRWAVAPPKAVTAAWIREIESRNLFKSVSPFDLQVSPDYLLTGAIERLEEVDRGSNVQIEVSLSAQLTDLRSGDVLWQSVSSKHATVDDRTVPGVVTEMSGAVHDAITDLASSLQDRARR